MKTVLVLCLTAASLLATDHALALGRMVDVSVVDRETGQELRPYYHRGEYFVVGVPGHKYSVSLRNRSQGRVMTVVSVDGVNAVSGETASPSQNGYVLSSGLYTQINGWRKSMDEVAAFVFSHEGASYAARTGRPDNIGVIGVAVFQERVITPPPQPYRRDEDRFKRDAPASQAKPKSQAETATAAPRLGTAHGEREGSRVVYTTFERAGNQPDEIVKIRYDSEDNLIAMGIIPRYRLYARSNPNPFPGRFVPDPN